MALKSKSKVAAKLINSNQIPELFPPVQYAFYGNTITRYKQKIVKKVPHLTLTYLGDPKTGHNLGS